LFHASCVQTQGVAPSIVVHGDGPLLPGFRALAELGARVIPAPSYRVSDRVEYTCRNTAGTLVEVEHERPWTLVCDPDFLFLEPLPKKAQSMCDGCAVSWDFVSYMQVGDFNRRWLADGCVERGANPSCVDKVKAGGVVPNFVRRDIHRDFAPRWLAAVDSLVKLAQANGEVPWVTIAWAFGLAAWEMELELALTRLTDTTHGGATAPESSLKVPILHYCYGDQSFDKRRHRGADSAAGVWTLDASGASVSAGFIRRLHAARDWYRERGLDVTDQHLYENGSSAAARTPKVEATPPTETPAPGSTCYVDSLPLAELSVGFGTLGLHGSLGYEGKLVAVEGKGFEHALSTHAPARLVFRLGGRSGRFRARVALNDDVPAGATNAAFSVFADDRLLAVAPHVEPGVSEVLEANVNGAEELELRVETTRFDYCHALWLDPEIELADGSDAVPQTLVDCLGRTEITLSKNSLRAKRCIATVASVGFAEMLDDLLGSIRSYANCPDALLVVFNIDSDDGCDRIAERHGAKTVHCARLGPKNATLKSLMYSAARVIDAEQFLCLDADMLVVGDLSPVFGMLEACPAASLLACREANSHYHQNVEHVLTTTYYGNPADLERIQGVKTDDGSYPLVVNDGLFAGDREALLALDAVIRGWPGAQAWVDELWHNSWRNQFIFNFAMARLRSGIELDAAYNVQLYWHDAELFEAQGRVRAKFRGRPVRVLHFNGTSRNKYPEWRPLIARGGSLPERREPRGTSGAELRTRTDVLNALASRFGLERYLEIGLGEPSRNFEHIVARVRESVDPNADATFRMPSDEFFADGLGSETYDLVFIDGLHEADQCLRDIENSLRRISPNGFIVLHDANPRTEWYQRPVEDYVPGSDWNGTVWKAVVRFRERHPELAVFTVDVDEGCTVIRASGGDPVPLSPEPPEKLYWALLERHRKEWLNLISSDEFRALLLEAQ
jgi:hypothetical protein